MALYEEKLRQVYEEAFLSGAVTDKVEAISTLIHSVNDERSLVAIETYDQSGEHILPFLNQRIEYVNSTGLMDE